MQYYVIIILLFHFICLIQNNQTRSELQIGLPSALLTVTIFGCVVIVDATCIGHEDEPDTKISKKQW